MFMSTLYSIPTHMLPVAAHFSITVSPCYCFFNCLLSCVSFYHVYFFCHTQLISYSPHVTWCLYSRIRLFWRFRYSSWFVCSGYFPPFSLGSVIFGTNYIDVFHLLIHSPSINCALVAVAPQTQLSSNQLHNQQLSKPTYNYVWSSFYHWWFQCQLTSGFSQVC